MSYLNNGKSIDNDDDDDNVMQDDWLKKMMNEPSHTNKINN